jgi:hypothetical protein
VTTPTRIAIDRKERAGACQRAGAAAALRRCEAAGYGGRVKAVAEITVALWLGAMGFFAFAVAPAAFAVLDREAAARLVSVVFPRYYAVGVALGVVAVVALLVDGAPADRGGGWTALLLVLVMLALTAYAWGGLLPAAHAAREAMHAAGAGSEAALRFARLHRLASALNGVVMLAGVAFLVVQARRRR